LRAYAARCDRLLLGHVPGFHLRRIAAASSPHVTGPLGACPWGTIRVLPGFEHIPTTLTGTYPHEHGLRYSRLTGTGTPLGWRGDSFAPPVRPSRRSS
jgi:hypothetical protein